MIRLRTARNLMVNAGLGAQATAVRVGCESTSQFSREFKCLFGDSPGVVAAQLRARLNEVHEPQLRATLPLTNKTFKDTPASRFGVIARCIDFPDGCYPENEFWRPRVLH